MFRKIALHRQAIVLLGGILALPPFCSADPRPKPTDYPAHAASARLDIGAEYLVHSFSNGKQTYLTSDYLVVDAAIYPHGDVVISASQFHLRINGQTTLVPQTPGMVSYTLKSAGYFGAGDNGGARFPGDPNSRPQSNPGLGASSSAPDHEPAEVAVVRTALPEGEFHWPVSGYLYFGFEGKLKKIKSMELIYDGGSGEIAVQLF